MLLIFINLAKKVRTDFDQIGHLVKPFLSLSSPLNPCVSLGSLASGLVTSCYGVRLYV